MEGSSKLDHFPGLEEGTWDWSGKTYEVPGGILTFAMEGQEVEVSMCRFTCSVQSTLRNAKHEPSRGVWGHAPQKNFEKSML